MRTPTPEQIAKLPKWAREHIENLERDALVATSRLDDMLDSQTPSPIYHEDMVSRGGEFKFSKHFVQARDLTFTHAGVALAVRLHRDDAIELSWGPETVHGLGDICFIPSAYQQARLTNMAHTPHEYRRLIVNRERQARSEQEKA
jgi:hypothetical protein